MEQEVSSFVFGLLIAFGSQGECGLQAFLAHFLRKSFWTGRNKASGVTFRVVGGDALLAAALPLIEQKPREWSVVQILRRSVILALGMVLDRLPDAVVCYLDSTVALPLLTSYALAKRTKRPLRRLYDRRGEMMDRLRREYEKTK